MLDSSSKKVVNNNICLISIHFMDKVLYIGRFQPFHLGHLDAVNQIFQDGAKELIIGIGSSQEELTTKNPFSYYERREMLEKVIVERFKDKKIEIYPIPDFSNSQKWVKHILHELPDFQILYSGNPYTEICFKDTDKDFRELNIRINIKATNIRQAILNNSNWQEYLPKEVSQYLKEKDAAKRIEEVYRIEDNISAQVNKASKKIKKVVIIEKTTRYSFLERVNYLDKLEEETKNGLELSHKNHIKVKKYLSLQLEEAGIDYTFLNDDYVNDFRCEDYDAIISLGGDGTFLQAAKNITNQYILGINSEPAFSEGMLTKYDTNELADIVEKMAKGTYEFTNWNRLSIAINGVRLPYLALNEVLVAKPMIYETSKLVIKIKDKKTYAIGNGIIVSTKVGSTAFYKSAGGVSFDTGNYGYVMLLPMKIKGKLETSKVLNGEEVVKVIPKRVGHIIIFDGDEDRMIRLNQEDEVEVFQNSVNSLRVII